MIVEDIFRVIDVNDWTVTSDCSVTTASGITKNSRLFGKSNKQQVISADAVNPKTSENVRLRSYKIMFRVYPPSFTINGMIDINVMKTDAVRFFLWEISTEEIPNEFL